MTTESNGLLVAGDLYIDRLTSDGGSQGFLEVANATQMALQQEIEFQDLTSRRKDTRGQLLASVAIPQPGEVSMTLNEINRDNLAMALLGERSDLDEEAETFSDETVTLKGYKWTEIGYRNLKKEGLSVEKESTELEEGTDFEINYRLGLIRALRDSDELTGDDDEVTISGETNALTGSRIRGAVQPTIKARLKLDGRNMVNDRPVIVTVDEALIRPTEAVDFLSEEFVSVPMTGRMRTLPGKDYPFTVELIDAD